jgi:hypothetical protein
MFFNDNKIAISGSEQRTKVDFNLFVCKGVSQINGLSEKQTSSFL